MVLWSSEKCSEATHINDRSSPLSRFLLYFAEIITLLVVKTNRYSHDHIDRLDEGPLPLPNMTEAKMLVFLETTIQMGHCIWDKPTDRLLVNNHQFHTHFYSSAMEQDRYLHFLHSLHFTDNKNEPDMTDENSDRLGKV
jgi:hypothetical protein